MIWLAWVFPLPLSIKKTRKSLKKRSMSFFVHETWTRNMNIYKRIPSVSHQITLKFSQILFWIQTQTRSRRHCGGPRPRRLTQRLFNRHLNVPREQSGLITCQDQLSFHFCNCCMIVLWPGCHWLVTFSWVGDCIRGNTWSSDPCSWISFFCKVH